MPGPLDLRPSLEKIARAERKFDHVKRMVNEWIAGGIPATTRIEVQNERAHVIARVESLPPEDIAWEIVEGVGHLRSALDKMLVALVHANGRGVSGVGFPFGGVDQEGKPEPFPSARHDALKKKLTPEQWALVLAQKPYAGGNDALWAVNEIANEDKHRKDLVRTRVVAGSIGGSITGGVLVMTGNKPGISVGGDPDFTCADQERETLLHSYAFGPGSTHPQIEGQLTAAVTFGNVKPIEGCEVISTLAQQTRLVKGIVELFAAAF